MHKTTELVLKFLKFYKAAHDGCSPTYLQIADGCDLASGSVVSYHLKKLAGAGLIRMPEDTNDIEVVGGQWTMEASAPARPSVRACTTCEYYGLCTDDLQKPDYCPAKEER